MYNSIMCIHHILKLYSSKDEPYVSGTINVGQMPKKKLKTLGWTFGIRVKTLPWMLAFHIRVPRFKSWLAFLIPASC